MGSVLCDAHGKLKFSIITGEARIFTLWWPHDLIYSVLFYFLGFVVVDFTLPTRIHLITLLNTLIL